MVAPEPALLACLHHKPAIHPHPRRTTSSLSEPTLSHRPALVPFHTVAFPAGRGGCQWPVTAHSIRVDGGPAWELFPAHRTPHTCTRPPSPGGKLGFGRTAHDDLVSYPPLIADHRPRTIRRVHPGASVSTRGPNSQRPFPLDLLYITRQTPPATRGCLTIRSRVIPLPGRLRLSQTTPSSRPIEPPSRRML